MLLLLIFHFPTSFLWVIAFKRGMELHVSSVMGRGYLDLKGCLHVVILQDWYMLFVSLFPWAPYCPSTHGLFSSQNRLRVHSVLKVLEVQAFPNQNWGAIFYGGDTAKMDIVISSRRTKTNEKSIVEKIDTWKMVSIYRWGGMHISARYLLFAW